MDNENIEHTQWPYYKFIGSMGTTHRGHYNKGTHDNCVLYQCAISYIIQDKNLEGG
jgi:hypothetical protein